MLIDTHAHLNDKRLLPLVDEVVANMDNDNLEAIINVSYDLESSIKSVELADKYNNIYAVVGLHPHDAKSASSELYDYIAKAVGNNKVVAVGEMGLDYYYDYSPRDVQARVFKEQIELADSLNMPIVIHLRDAYQDMLEILKDMKKRLNNGLVLHCYSGSADMAEIYNQFDAYYSFGGAITFAKNKDKVVRSIPKDRLLLETDCPYMTPVPMRGKLNYPAYVKYVRDQMAQFLNITNDEMNTITNTNAKRLFRRLI